MATAPKLDLVPTESADIVVAVTANPGIVLLDQAKRDQFYDRMKAETDKHVADTSTSKGRDEIRSLAFRVTKAKTGIEAAKKKLTEEWRQQTALANAAGKEIVDRLDALADEVRKPLTAWEQAEEARVATCDRIMAEMKAAAVVTLDDTAATVRQRGSEIYNTILDADVFGDGLASAVTVKDSVVAVLKTALLRLTKEEADRAELEKLRAANAEREAREAEEAAAREQAEHDAEAARVAEEQRVAAEQAEAQRIADAEKAATEKAQREATERHAAELAAEREKLAAVERDAQAERDRVAELERQRLAKEDAAKAEADKLAAEQAERERNKAHRARVKTAAKLAIMTCGADEETAQKIVLAVIAGEVPAMALDFRS